MPMKRILVVPDVHGRLFWKEPVRKYIYTVDRVVFLGDYLDPYEGEEGLAEDIFENMMEIVRLKRNNREKVVLLKGNHDQHYASERLRSWPVVLAWIIRTGTSIIRRLWITRMCSRLHTWSLLKGCLMFSHMQA
jgi:predicted phosphodiesterase